MANGEGDALKVKLEVEVEKDIMVIGRCEWELSKEASAAVVW